jgi:uncharacterized membrane protein YkvA (DUF1232 family)
MAPLSWLARPGLLLAQARLALRLVREPAVPMLVKAIPVLAAVYLVWPLDLVPDIFPALGQLDDVGVVMAGLALFLRLCPDAPAAFHRSALAAGRRFSTMPGQGDVIDGKFRRE